MICYNLLKIDFAIFQHFLEKYGYLKCSGPAGRSRRSASGSIGPPSPPAPAPDSSVGSPPGSSSGSAPGAEATSRPRMSPRTMPGVPAGPPPQPIPGFNPHEAVAIEPDPCPRQLVDEALKLFQKQYHIRETGHFDKATMDVMNTKRCGNADDAVEKLPPVKIEKETKPESSTRIRRSAIDIIDKHHRQIRLEEVRSLKQSSPILNALSQHSQQKHNTQSVRRRMQMLNDIREGILKTEKQPTKKSGEPVAGEHRHARVKRSTPLLNVTYVNGFNRFNKAPGEPITWRILETMYSTQMTVATQKAVMNLGFRMFSEVIPLKFEESVEGSINDVNIEIAFAKRKCNNFHYMYHELCWTNEKDSFE